MGHSCLFSIAVLLVTVYVVKAAIFRRVQNNVTGIEERVLINTRRKSPKQESSESEKATSEREDLQFKSSEVPTTSSDEVNTGDESASRRKCTKCREDMLKKWRQPDIRWICGAYQRAHRSFKSPCMMEYRNCQDGTMFVKISEHRCKDDDKNGDKGMWHGEHMFYDYKVKIAGDISGNRDSVSLSESSGSYSFEKYTKKPKLIN